MKINAILLASAVVVGSPGAAQMSDDWRYIDSNSSGSEFYLRTQDWLAGRSQQRSARAWVKTEDGRNARVPWMESKVLYEVDCVAFTYRLLQATWYYRGGKVRREALNTRRQ
jgi:hypothetical protein